MSTSHKVLFVDRDGTLVEEPSDQQVDSVEKIRFMPGVFAALNELLRSDFRLAMVTNQDGLGTASFPMADFEKAHQFIINAFRSQGIEFEQVFVCPHFKKDDCECRKPKTGLVRDFVRDGNVDLAASVMIGDRETDLEFARNLGVRGLRVLIDGSPEETWPAITNLLLARQAQVERNTKETRISVVVNLDATAPIRAVTGIGFFDHMLEQLGKHGGFALDLTCNGDLHIDEHHTVEDTALALGDALRRALGNKLGIQRYGFLLPMDEARVQVGIDLSGRAYSVFEGKFPREQVGTLPTELVPHFFRSLAEGLGAAIQISVIGDNTHHMIETCFKGVGRALRQAFKREGHELPSTKGIL
jgi:imidazoleglycerol-phosphate dehydratase/histidinol-phosphatase